jgi:hypothetical protein
MHSKPFLVVLILFFFACKNAASPYGEQVLQNINGDIENPYVRISEIPLPAGFKRIQSAKESFASWLRNVHLKKNKTVYKYDGRPKANQHAQFAVLDISVGKKDLQQCADAVMRLKAAYLFEQEQYDEIIFYDNNGKGYKLEKPFTRNNFDAYLQRIFGMCGSASLSKQLHAVNKFNDISPGDVLIRGGFPGHAVIVMDVATDDHGKKIYLLAQSYMPAQDIHILINPSQASISPWYLVTDDTIIKTPEYIFRSNELKRW